MEQFADNPRAGGGHACGRENKSGGIPAADLEKFAYIDRAS